MAKHNTGHMGHLHLLLHAGCGAGLVVGLLLFYVVVIRPYSAQHAVNSERSQQLETLLRPSLQVRRDALLARKELADLKQRIKRVQALVPATAESSSFMAKLNEAADRFNVRMVDYRQENDRTSGPVSQMEISLNCVGKYDDLCKFLAEAQQIPRVAEFKQIHITSPESRDEYPMEIRLSLFYGLAQATEESPAS